MLMGRTKSCMHRKDDYKKIELETPMYDALCAFFQHQVGQRQQT